MQTYNQARRAASPYNLAIAFVEKEGVIEKLTVFKEFLKTLKVLTFDCHLGQLRIHDLD